MSNSLVMGVIFIIATEIQKHLTFLGQVLFVKLN